MKSRILKINGVEFGIGDEYLVCPYTEEVLKKTWTESVTNLMQKSNTSNLGDHWILDCKDLDVFYKEDNLSKIDEYKITTILSDRVDVKTSFDNSKKPIIFLLSDRRLFVRIK